MSVLLYVHLRVRFWSFRASTIFADAAKVKTLIIFVLIFLPLLLDSGRFLCARRSVLVARLLRVSVTDFLRWQSQAA